MTDRHAWTEGEPDLADLLSDPIVDALLRRDGLTRRDVWHAVDLARRRLEPERGTASAAA